jgi:hypothetical protein
MTDYWEQWVSGCVPRSAASVDISVWSGNGSEVRFSPRPLQARVVADPVVQAPEGDTAESAESPVPTVPSATSVHLESRTPPTRSTPRGSPSAPTASRVPGPKPARANSCRYGRHQSSLL